MELRKNGLPAVVLAVVVGSLPAFLVATLAIQMRHSLHFDATALGISIAVFNLGAAISSVPTGRLVEHIGGARVMRLEMVLAAVLLALIGEAPSWAVLTVVLLVAGMVSGGMNPAANLFLARRSSPERQGLVFGVKQAAVPLASLLGGLAVPAVALTLGWRWAFYMAGLLAAVTAACLPAPRTSLAERRRQPRQAAGGRVVSTPLVTLTFGLGLGVVASSGCSAFLVSAAAALGFAPGAAGLVAALAAAASITVRVGIGAQADRQSGGHLRVVAAMLTIGVAGYLTLGAGTVSHSHLLFIVGAVIGLGVGWGWNGLFTFSIVRAYAAAPAAATSVTQVGGRIGGMVGPALIGFVADQASYSAAWFVAAATGLVAAGAVLVGYRLLVARPAVPAPAEQDQVADAFSVPGS